MRLQDIQGLISCDKIKMKNVSHLLFLLLSLPFIFGSCRDNETKEEISSIDSLYRAVLSADSLIRYVDVEKISGYKEEIVTNMGYIQKNFNDSMTNELRILLTDYYAIRKPLRVLLSRTEFYMQELNYSKEQLQNLKHDIEQGTIEKEQFSKHLETENQAISGLVKEIRQYTDVLNTKIEFFIRTNPSILELIRKLKEEKESIKD